MLATILLLGHSTQVHSCLRADVHRLPGRQYVAVYHDAHGAWTRTRPSLVLIDADSEHTDDALAAARTLRAADARLPIVLLAQASSEALAIAALQAGISDYVKGTPDPGALGRLLSRWMPPAPSTTSDDPTLVGDSEAMRRIRAHAETVGGTDSSVLITGETGTGKELVARLLHEHSPRRNCAFVSINCAAIPDSLLESELFGYERGAFTGAQASHDGHLRAAHGGTVLFDEIGEMTPYAQAKILRALDAREVYRLGSTKRLPLDIRVIAATNQDLVQLMGDGRFRKDLYYRLNVVRVRMPPLRERREDIAALVDHYVAALNRRYQRSVIGFPGDVVNQMTQYDWPGNVREVRNVVEGAYAELPGGDVKFLAAPSALLDRLRETQSAPAEERDRLLAALRDARWNKSRAAEHLRWSRMTLYRKIAKYGLNGLSRL